MHAQWGEQVHFVDVLVRQGHPGPGVAHYQRLEQKWRDGERYAQEHAIAWPVLVDDLRGTVHQVYGAVADPVYLIGTDGRVALYQLITHAPTLDRALTRLLAQGGHGRVAGGLDRTPHLFAPMVLGWPALRRGLPQSFWDLMMAAPGSPIAAWLGWQLRPLLGPLAKRAKPLPRWPLLGGFLALVVAAALLARRALGPRLPVRERETSRPFNHERPQAVPTEAQQGERPLQLTHEGEGPLFHRRYRADIAHPTETPESLMGRIQADPNGFSPQAMARFEKQVGAEGQMQVGDEFLIHITGPWNGPVRVIEATPTTFALITLEGHVEAGEIRFRARPHPARPAALRFEILSWARSRDGLVDLLYDKVPLVKEAQTRMWVHFLERAVAASGGTLIGAIDVVTEEQPFVGEVIARE